ncbi:T9SS type A sorting domain-containing protein [Psychroflexus salis]|uniref:T9SS type A sorting domain-containing protein n=1 Tax=Psychroflexus salis TaxID=1526574 RepID=UPI00166E7B80
MKSQQPIHQIEVFNLSGKRILNEAYQENQAIDVSGLPSGMYILKIETENGSVTKKLVKE